MTENEITVMINENEGGWLEFSLWGQEFREIPKLVFDPVHNVVEIKGYGFAFGADSKRELQAWIAMLQKIEQEWK